MKEETREYLNSAEENIRAADLLTKAHYFDIAVSRSYYAVFYIAQALLLEEGKKCSSHKQVQSTFGKLFSKTGKLDSKFHRYLIAGFRKRQIADYAKNTDIDEEEAVAATNQAEEFLLAAKNYLG